MEKSKKIKWIISFFALFLFCACIGIFLSSANNNKNVYAASWSGDYSTSTESGVTVYTSKSLYTEDTANILSYSSTLSMSSFNTFTL